MQITQFKSQPRFPILAPANVSASLPVYSFAAETGLGFGRNGAGAIGFYYAGALRAQIIQGTFDLLQDTAMLRFGSGTDTILQRDGAANTLALRNSTNAQTFRVYNTYTDASNYEQGFARWAGNAFELGTTYVGSGASRVISFRPGNLAGWSFNTSGYLIANVDNTYDIGASGATRPRNVYVGSNISAAGGIGVGGVAAISGAHLNIAASTTAAASLRLAATGVAPTAPTNGDVWFDGTDVKIRVGGVTKTFTLV